MRVLRNIATTVALVICAAAGGWYGVHALRSLRGEAGVQRGDYSAIVRQAGHPVVLFSTTTCPHCARARRVLDALGIDYVVYEIDVSPAARELYAQVGSRSVPVLVTADRRVTGFQEAGYRSIVSDGGPRQ
jgi:glutaredoxin